MLSNDIFRLINSPQPQFKTTRLSNLQLDASVLKQGKKVSSKPLGTLTTSRNSYHLVPSSVPSASSSSSNNLPKGVNLEQEPDLRPSLVDSMLPADQVGRGARSAGDTDRDLEREGAVKAELGLDGSKAAGAEEMQGLKLLVPDGRRAGFFMGEYTETEAIDSLLFPDVVCLKQLRSSRRGMSSLLPLWDPPWMLKIRAPLSTLQPPKRQAQHLRPRTVTHSLPVSSTEIFLSARSTPIPPISLAVRERMLARTPWSRLMRSGKNRLQPRW